MLQNRFLPALPSRLCALFAWCVSGLITVIVVLASSASLLSAQSPPVVTSAVPAGGIRGTTVTVTLNGTNLNGVTVSFSGAGLTVTSPVRSDGTAGNVPISIAPDTALGPQTMTITTLGGTTTVCGARLCTFTVEDPGSWTDVTTPLTQDQALGPVVRLLDGRLLIAGGELVRPPGAGPSVPTGSVYIFDPATMGWAMTGPMNIVRSASTATLLPDGRVFVAGGLGDSGYTPATEIYDPQTGTWSLAGSLLDSTNHPVGSALLLPNGKVLLLYAGSNFDAELFDPVTQQFEKAAGSAFQGSTYGTAAILSDGRVLIVSGGTQNRIYDPATATLSSAPDLPFSDSGEHARLLPDGRVLVRGTFCLTGLSCTARPSLYDPRTNTATPASFFLTGEDVLLSDGSVLISDVLGGIHGEFFGETIQYDAATDRMFFQTNGSPPVAPTTLLDDGRAFGISWRESSAAQVNGTFAQVYTPPAYMNPAPVIGSVVAAGSTFTGTATLPLDIHGAYFLPNSAVRLGTTKLVTLYLGSQHLIAFVPPALRLTLSAGITVNNPAAGGGSTAPVNVGFTSTVPLPIPDVESGQVRSGYVVVTPDSGSPAPLSTLTYGIVHNAIVQSQAAILPAPLTTQAPLIVDVVQTIGRNLGVAIANTSGTAALISFTLRNEDGTLAAVPATVSIAPQNQIARFVTELFPGNTVGAAFRGSVTVQSSVAVSIIGLQFSGQAFSTLPISAAPGSVSGNAIVFPQFAIAGGWATTLGLLNSSSNAISGRVDVFDQSGNPLTVSLNGFTQSTFRYSIPSGGALLLAPRDSNGQSPF